LKQDYSSNKEPLHESAMFHYIIILLIIATLVVSILTWINVNESKKSSGAQITGRAVGIVDANDFLGKLTAHDETKAYAGVSPLNIVQVDSDNIANLQAQISDLDQSYLGDFIVQYDTGAIVIYDYNNDVIKGTISQQLGQAQLPADFFAKINPHPELAGLEAEQPIGGQLDGASLNTLKQQFPEVYANAKVGDYLLRYETRLVIYDYNADAIVNAVNLG